MFVHAFLWARCVGVFGAPSPRLRLLGLRRVGAACVCACSRVRLHACGASLRGVSLPYACGGCFAVLACLLACGSVRVCVFALGVCLPRSPPRSVCALVVCVCVVKERKRERAGEHNAPRPLPSSFGWCCGGVLLSHTLPGAVPSALWGLASRFGMGSGRFPHAMTTAKSLILPHPPV